MLDADKIGPHTLKAASFASKLAFHDIPGDVIHFAKRSILDGIGCAVRGTMMEAGRFILDYADTCADAGEAATIWGVGKKVSARLAGLVNGALAQTPNTGDDHHASGIHTNYLMPQTAIALGEQNHLSGADVLTAYVAGNEVAVRAAMATHVLDQGGYFNAEGRGWQSTGCLGPIGTSITAGKMLGLGTAPMVQALVLGGTQLGGVYRPAGSFMGKTLMAGKAVAAGIENAEIARTGFTAGYRLYEDGLCFGSGIISAAHEIEKTTAGLGEAWETPNGDFCIYPTKKTFNTNMDALLHILKSEKISFGDIAEIRVLTAYGDAHVPKEITKIESSTEAFNNLRYVIAAAAYDGDFWFEQLEEDHFSNRTLLDFAREKVRIVADPELEKLRPERWAGAIEILTRDGQRHYKRADIHKGEHENPLTDLELEAKFRRSAGTLSDSNQDAVIEAVWRLDSLTDLSLLTKHLAP
ncbi:MAG: MmgE/PrpD family protein [Proteobacteria bacterium]|nr:MmgE/PrpD family protein [Pseudomonadota bacterium]